MACPNFQISLHTLSFSFFPPAWTFLYLLDVLSENERYLS